MSLLNTGVFSVGHEERCINKEPAVRQVLVKLLDKPVILTQTESVAWSQASDVTVMNECVCLSGGQATVVKESRHSVPASALITCCVLQNESLAC